MAATPEIVLLVALAFFGTLFVLATILSIYRYRRKKAELHRSFVLRYGTVQRKNEENQQRISKMFGMDGNRLPDYGAVVEGRAGGSRVDMRAWEQMDGCVLKTERVLQNETRLHSHGDVWVSAPTFPVRSDSNPFIVSPPHSCRCGGSFQSVCSPQISRSLTHNYYYGGSRATTPIRSCFTTQDSFGFIEGHSNIENLPAAPERCVHRRVASVPVSVGMCAEKIHRFSRNANGGHENPGEQDIEDGQAKADWTNMGLERGVVVLEGLSPPSYTDVGGYKQA